MRNPADYRYMRRDIRTGNIIDLIVGAGSNRKARYIAFTMIHHRVDIRGENRLVIIVHMHGRVSPPQEGLRFAGSVKELNADFQVSAVGVKPEAVHPLGTKHHFNLCAPDRFAAIGVLFDPPI